MTDPGDLTELNRAIGRIEGTQGQIIRKLDAIIVDAVNHQKDDRRDFEAIRKQLDHKVGEVRKASAGENAGQDDAIAAQALRIDELEKQNERERGAGWVIVSLIGASVSALGTMAWAIFSGHIIWKP
jgi:hypothetical protein